MASHLTPTLFRQILGRIEDLRYRLGAVVETSIYVPSRRRGAMRPMVAVLGLVGVVGLAVGPGAAVAQTAKNVAAKSPWGPADEIGTLNMMTNASRSDALKQVAGGAVRRPRAHRPGLDRGRQPVVGCRRSEG